MINIRKFQTLFSFCSQIKCWYSELKFTEYPSEQQTGKTLIRLLPQKQSDLVLHCFSMPFWQANSVQSLKTRRFLDEKSYIHESQKKKYNFAECDFDILQSMNLSVHNLRSRVAPW